MNMTNEQIERMQNASPQLFNALMELRITYLFNQTKGQRKNNHLNETLQQVNNALLAADPSIDFDAIDNR